MQSQETIKKAVDSMHNSKPHTPTPHELKDMFETDGDAPYSSHGNTELANRWGS